MYPTVANRHDDYGLAVYEIRGDQVYPTVANRRDDYGLAVYEIR